MDSSLPQPEQPGTSVLAALFRHNAWASLQLLDFCEGLSDEQLDATAVGTFGSIRDTLAHYVYAEVSYVERADGKLPPNQPPGDGFAGFEVLREAVRWAGDELLRLATSARADSIVTHHMEEGTEQYKLTDLMVQAVTHSTEHRTQIQTVLTNLGLEPPDLSAWQWMWDRGELWVARKASAE